MTNQHAAALRTQAWAPSAPRLRPALRGVGLAWLALALWLWSATACAELTNEALLDQLTSAYALRAKGWQAVMMDAAFWLFWTLGTISLAWTGGMMVLRKADLGEFFAEFIRFIVFFGFFLWLLRNGPAFADSIVKAMLALGTQAAGYADATPSGIVDIGFLIWQQSVNELSLLGASQGLVGVLLSGAILLLLAAIAVHMLLLQIAGWILMYAGIFLLGFGGSRWTSDIAISYYKTVLAVGVQLLTMVLLVGVGNDLLQHAYLRMQQPSHNFNELAIVLVLCLALWMLVRRLPVLVAGIITAGAGNAGSLGSFAAGAAAGAGAGAAAGAAAWGGLGGWIGASPGAAAGMAHQDPAAGTHAPASGALALMAAHRQAAAAIAAAAGDPAAGDPAAGAPAAGAPDPGRWRTVLDAAEGGDGTAGSASALRALRAGRRSSVGRDRSGDGTAAPQSGPGRHASSGQVDSAAQAMPTAGAPGSGCADLGRSVAAPEVAACVSPAARHA